MYKFRLSKSSLANDLKIEPVESDIKVHKSERARNKRKSHALQESELKKLGLNQFMCDLINDGASRQYSDGTYFCFDRNLNLFTHYRFI